MKNLDILYEAYQNYKKLCIVDNDTSRFLGAYMRIKDKASEDVVSVFSVCHIEQDWVEAIERGIPFIEKAIREERQFIRNDGEVLPIEKIRKTSKTSIQDLAKHANYITHEAPEDAETEVLPDKMLMIQKESDFAIYENRVLYAALMYLKDFVASRLVEIKETTNTYLVRQHINKLIDMGSRKINIDLKYNESRVNDPLLTEKNNEKEVIDRLDEILTNILALLKTPLMREVSKVEMVSRPIAKTNILKMNRNFRESLACFEYIANYQGKGFTIEHIEKSLIPYSKQMNESYTESLIMLSFINYMYANGITQELRNDYEEILKQRERQKENEVLAKLREFRATANEKEQTLNEFLILFEQGYRILETRNDEMSIAIKENEIRRQKELKELQEKHEAFVDDLKEQFEEEKKELNRQNAEKLNEFEQECEQRLFEANNEKEDEIRRMREQTSQEVRDIKESSANELKEYKGQFDDHIKEMERENAEIKSHYQELNEKIAVLETEALRYRVANGDAKDVDFNSEDAFDKLEQMKKDFDAFYEKAWKAAKKQIRKDALLSGWGKKKKKGKDEEEPLPEPAPAPAPETPKEPEPAPQPEPEPQPEPIKEEPVVEQPVQEEAPVEETPAPEVPNEEPEVEEAPVEEPQNEEPIEETPQEEPLEADENNEEEKVEEDVAE